jgi:flavin-binding protein dodecin
VLVSAQRNDSNRESLMSSRVYKTIDIVGSSSAGVEDAIRGAVAKASETVRELRWFEVKEVRGHIDNGEVSHFQVSLRLGFLISDTA